VRKGIGFSKTAQMHKIGVALTINVRFFGESVYSNNFRTLSDKERAKIKGAHGYIQGYNGIAVVDSKNQVIVGAEVFESGNDSDYFPRMLDTVKERMNEMSEKEDAPEDTILEGGDTGYFSQNNLKAAKERGVKVIIPDQQFCQREF
jgi:hypothetical protein